MFPKDWVDYTIWTYLFDTGIVWAVLIIGVCLLMLIPIVTLLWMFRERKVKRNTTNHKFNMSTVTNDCYNFYRELFGFIKGKDKEK